MNQNCTASFSVYNNGPETLIYYSGLFLYHDHIRWSFLFPLLHCRKLIWNIIMLLPKISMAVELQSAHCLLGDIVWYCPLIYHGPFLSHLCTVPANIPASVWWACMDNGGCGFMLVCFCFVCFHPRSAMIAQCCLKTGRNTKVCNQPMVLSAQKLELLYSTMLLIFFRKDFLKSSLENESWFFFSFLKKNP